MLEAFVIDHTLLLKQQSRIVNRREIFSIRWTSWHFRSINLTTVWSVSKCSHSRYDMIWASHSPPYLVQVMYSATFHTSALPQSAHSLTDDKMLQRLLVWCKYVWDKSSDLVWFHLIRHSNFLTCICLCLCCSQSGWKIWSGLARVAFAMLQSVRLHGHATILRSFLLLYFTGLHIFPASLWFASSLGQQLCLSIRLQWLYAYEVLSFMLSQHVCQESDVWSVALPPFLLSVLVAVYGSWVVQLSITWNAK